MSPEFSAGSKVETITNPFRVEKVHRIMLAQTRHEMQNAGKRMKDFWLSFVRYGIPTALQRAQQIDQVVQFEAPDATGIKAWYQVQYQYSGVDRRTQPIDVFHMTKEDPDTSEPSVKMAIATYRGKSSRYGRLVALETMEEAEEIPSHLFYFQGDDLVKMRQIAQPQTLFPVQAEQMQFFEINLGEIAGEIEVEIGLVGDAKKDRHTYKHIGHGLVRTHLLRVSDGFTGEVDLFSISENGTVQEPASFLLPQAVANISNFQPAITAQSNEEL